jgi:hypothetical protein
MSQAAVEKALGKLITDECFRRRFFKDPAAASFAAGLELSQAEADALSRLPLGAIIQFSACLDARICRLSLEEDQRPAPADAPEAEENRSPVQWRAGIGTARCARKGTSEGSTTSPADVLKESGPTDSSQDPDEPGPAVNAAVNVRKEQR